MAPVNHGRLGPSGMQQQLSPLPGLLATPALLAVMVVGVILLSIVAWLRNRPLGTPVPVWFVES
jgi:hypothetical protein